MRTLHVAHGSPYVHSWPKHLFVWTEGENPHMQDVASSLCGSFKVGGPYEHLFLSEGRIPGTLDGLEVASDGLLAWYGETVTCKECRDKYNDLGRENTMRVYGSYALDEMIGQVMFRTGNIRQEIETMLDSMDDQRKDALRICLMLIHEQAQALCRDLHLCLNPWDVICYRKGGGL